MAMNLQTPDIRELKPHITVFGVGGAGGNAVNNMIESGLEGVEFVVSNTDAQNHVRFEGPGIRAAGPSGKIAGEPPTVQGNLAQSRVTVLDSATSAHLM